MEGVQKLTQQQQLKAIHTSCVDFCSQLTSVDIRLNIYRSRFFSFESLFIKETQTERDLEPLLVPLIDQVSKVHSDFAADSLLIHP